MGEDSPTSGRFVGRHPRCCFALTAHHIRLSTIRWHQAIELSVRSSFFQLSFSILGRYRRWMRTKFANLSRNACRTLASVAIIVPVAIALPSLACATDTQFRLEVGVTVLPMARIDVKSVPATLDVSTADIRRGYIEVSKPTVVEIKSNSPLGYVLNVISRQAIFTAVDILGLDVPVHLAADGGVVVQRWNATERHSIRELTYRFQLSDSARPGRYAWPIQLAVGAL